MKRSISVAFVVILLVGGVAGPMSGSVAASNTTQTGPIDEIPDSALSDAEYLTDMSVTGEYIAVLYNRDAGVDEPYLLTYNRDTGAVNQQPLTAGEVYYDSTLKAVSETSFAYPDDDDVRVFNAETQTGSVFSPETVYGDLGSHAVGFKLFNGDSGVYAAVGTDTTSGDYLVEVTPTGLEQAAGGTPIGSNSGTSPELYGGYVTDQYVLATEQSTSYFDVNLFSTATGDEVGSAAPGYQNAGEYDKLTSVRVNDSTVRLAGRPRGSGSDSTFIVDADLTTETVSEVTEIPNSGGQDDGAGSPSYTNQNLALTDRDTVLINDAPSYDTITEYALNGSAVSSFSTDGNALVTRSGSGVYSLSETSGSVHQYELPPPPAPENISLSVDRNPIELNRSDPNIGNATVTAEYENGTTETVTDFSLSSDDIRTLVTVDDMYFVADLYDADPTSANLTASYTAEDGTTLTDSVSVSVTGAETNVSVSGDARGIIERDTTETIPVTITNDGNVDTQVDLVYRLENETTETTRQLTLTQIAQWDGTVNDTAEYAVPNVSAGEYQLVREVYVGGDNTEPVSESRQSVRVVENLSALPTAEITQIDTSDALLSDGSDATVTVSVTNTDNTINTFDVSVSPVNGTSETTAQVGPLQPYETQTVTVTPDEQPTDENGTVYDVTTVDDSAQVTLSARVGPPTFDNIAHPSFDTMDRVLAIVSDTTVVILFLITGASAMLASETNGILGSVLFTFLLLPAWLVIGTPLYLFAAAIPLVPIFYSSQQGGPTKTEVRVKGLR